MADLMVAGFAFGIINPFLPCSMYEALPTSWLAMTGKPVAIASKRLYPSGSLEAGRMKRL